MQEEPVKFRSEREQQWVDDAIEYLRTRATSRYGYVKGDFGGWVWELK